MVLATLTAVAAVGGLWRWSAEASDPLAPGGSASIGESAAGVPVGDPPSDPSVGSAGVRTGSTGGTAGGGTGDPEARSMVHAAAGATAAAPALRFTLGIVLADESTTPPATEITGTVDNVSGDVAVTLREWVSGSGSVPTTLEAIAVDDALYVRSSALAPGGEPAVWWRVPADAGGQGTPAMVSGLVALVGRTRSAEFAGRETVDGTEVTRLRVELPGGDDQPAVVGSAAGWGVVGVDGDGQLRSIEVRAVGAWGQAAGRSVLVRLVLDHPGDRIEIVPPDAAAVRDLGADGGAAAGVGADPGGGVGVGGAGG